MTWQQRALYQLMSDISEDCYCAGWMNGNEYTLWEMLTTPTAPRNYGMGQVSDRDIAEMRAISNDIGGWIRWHDDADEPDLPANEWGPRFEALEDWQRRYDKQKAEWATLSGSAS